MMSAGMDRVSTDVDKLGASLGLHETQRTSSQPVLFNFCLENFIPSLASSGCI